MCHQDEVFSIVTQWHVRRDLGKMRMRCLPLALMIGLLTLPEPIRAQSAEARGVVIASEKAASEAGLAILRKGGSAADAAVTAALMLMVIAPQSASPGGEGAALSYTAQDRSVDSWDGTATAPAAAGADLFLGRDGKPMTLDAVRPGGRAVGVPGVMRMLEALHKAHGTLAWAQLVSPAIEIAEKGFPISPALARAIAETDAAPLPDRRGDLRPNAATPSTATPNSTTILRNTPLAEMLRQVAASGADAVLRGSVATDIATLVRNDASPGLLTADDLAAYAAPPRKPLCTPYHGLLVCSPGGASLGGVALARSLGVLDHTPLPRLDPAGAQASMLLLRAWQASRHDVAANLADSEFAPDAIATLTNPVRLAADAHDLEINRTKSTPIAAPDPAPILAPETSGAVVLAVDGQGNAVSLSLSLHSRFGARLLLHGFALNDALAGFAPQPIIDGHSLSNRVEGGKHPLSAMAPAIVLDPRGRLRFVVGAEAGEEGVTQEAQMLLHVIDFHQSPSAAAAAPMWHLHDGALELEDGVGARLLLDLLRQSGTAPRLVPRAGHAALIAWFESGAEGAPTMPAEMGFGRQ